MNETTGDSFDDMKFFNPWEVRIDDGINPKLVDIFKKHPLLQKPFFTFLDELKTFPPNADHFKEPMRSYYEEGVWVTITDGHIRLALLVEYRKHEQTCWVVEAALDVPRGHDWLKDWYKKKKF